MLHLQQKAETGWPKEQIIGESYSSKASNGVLYKDRQLNEEWTKVKKDRRINSTGKQWTRFNGVTLNTKNR